MQASSTFLSCQYDVVYWPGYVQLYLVKCTLWLQGLKVHKSKFLTIHNSCEGLFYHLSHDRGEPVNLFQWLNYNPYNTVTQISTAQSLSLPSTPKMWNPLQSVSNNNVLCSFRVHNCLHIQYNYSFN